MFIVAIYGRKMPAIPRVKIKKPHTNVCYTALCDFSIVIWIVVNVFLVYGNTELRRGYHQAFYPLIVYPFMMGLCLERLMMG